MYLLYQKFTDNVQKARTLDYINIKMIKETIALNNNIYNDNKSNVI